MKKRKTRELPALPQACLARSSKCRAAKCIVYGNEKRGEKEKRRTKRRKVKRKAADHTVRSL